VISTRHLSSRLVAVGLVLLLNACTTPGTPMGETEVRRGVVEEIRQVQLESNHHPGVGAVVGGAAGVGVGSLIGSGTGRDVAMVLGAIGGALAGNEAQKKYQTPVQGQQVTVRTTSGVLVSITQPTNPALRKGQQVYIDGNGEGARVVPQ
jgi:outer membrane lipoprotein SlyB